MASNFERGAARYGSLASVWTSCRPVASVLATRRSGRRLSTSESRPTRPPARSGFRRLEALRLVGRLGQHHEELLHETRVALGVFLVDGGELRQSVDRGAAEVGKVP